MDVFPIAPATSKPLWFVFAIAVVLLIIALALLFTAYASRHSQIKLTASELLVSGDFWSRSIPRTHLLVDQLQVIDLNNAGNLTPKRRTLGTGLPGWSSGWFRLYNNEKALLYVSNRRQVVYLPTLEGYSLMFSLEDAEAFITKLKSG